MAPDQKPREFWIYEGDSDAMIAYASEFENSSRAIDPYPKKYHVIEYSAYDALRQHCKLLLSESGPAYQKLIHQVDAERARSAKLREALELLLTRLKDEDDDWKYEDTIETAKAALALDAENKE